MYTFCEENAGFDQQKSTTDPVKYSAHMNNVWFKVFSQKRLYMFVKVVFFFYSSTILMSLVHAFVDVNICCRCAIYLVQLQNIQKVDMIVCMHNCLDLYIDHVHNMS